MYSFSNTGEEHMANNEEELRRVAIERYLLGEAPSTIWTSLDRSKRWFYKWLSRYRTKKEGWYSDQSKKPYSHPRRTPSEIVEIVKHVRLELYNQGLFCGSQAILWRLQELSVKPLPSERTIGRILSKHELTFKRTGRYEPKGKKYPSLSAKFPGDVHQTDYVGPCYLKKPIRFYSLNSIDIATGRCATEPVVEGRGDNKTIEAVWAIWHRLGMPKYQQIDNEMVFYGSPTNPRGMGKLIRLCLQNKVEPVFIPIREPWRNGVVEKFNDHWRQKFLRRVPMFSQEELEVESLCFEEKHNTKYRYSKLGGKTPIDTLVSSKAKLRFPPTVEPPCVPLRKPESGQYHLIRFIRSDGIINIFGENFLAPPETMYEYVKATIDVSKQNLSLYLDNKIIETWEYELK